MSDSSQGSGGKSLGTLSLVFGVLALVGVLMIGQSSFGWFGAFDPAGWLRIVTAWMLPMGAIGAVVFGVLSFVRRSARPLGLAGLSLAVISVGIFVAMLVTHPY